MAKPIAPITKRADGYWIDTSELLSDLPEYGPYTTRAEADEDREAVAQQIKDRRFLGLKRPDEECAIRPFELRDTLLLVKRYTRSSFRLDRLKPEQVNEVGTKVLALKSMLPGSLVMSLGVLKVLLYREAGIDPSWPAADDYFYTWANNFTKSDTQKVGK